MNTNVKLQPHTSEIIKTLVIVINWNGDQDLIDCLDSLRGAREGLADPYDVLVLDNASTSGSLDRAERDFPWAAFLRLPENRYWAGGNNAAIQWALTRGYDWLVFSNSDIVVDKTWYPALEAVNHELRVGAVGFKIFGEAERVPYKTFESYRASFSLDELDWHDDIFISGCFLAVRASCFSNLGTFDEVYKMYCEEFDFLSRARLAGWRTVRCNAPIYHVSELASRKVPLLTSYFAIRNNIRVMIKLGPNRVRAPLKYAARILLRMISPWDKVDLVNSCRRREKPTANLFQNFRIWTQACAWNLLSLPVTLAAGRRDVRTALASRTAHTA